MKGITPVIAIILLLLITISMVGFAFVWFQRVAQIATDTTTSQLHNQLDSQGQKISIDNANSPTGNITMRHTGTTATNTAQIIVYVNTINANCAWDIPGAWAPGTFKSCTVVDGFTCTGSTRIEASAPGNRDAIIC